MTRVLWSWACPGFSLTDGLSGGGGWRRLSGDIMCDWRKGRRTCQKHSELWGPSASCPHVMEGREESLRASRAGRNHRHAANSFSFLPSVLSSLPLLLSPLFSVLPSSPPFVPFLKGPNRKGRGHGKRCGQEKGPQESDMSQTGSISSDSSV